MCEEWQSYFCQSIEIGKYLEVKSFSDWNWKKSQSMSLRGGETRHRLFPSDIGFINFFSLLCSFCVQREKRKEWTRRTASFVCSFCQSIEPLARMLWLLSLFFIGSSSIQLDFNTPIEKLLLVDDRLFRWNEPFSPSESFITVGEEKMSPSSCFVQRKEKKKKSDVCWPSSSDLCRTDDWLNEVMSCSYQPVCYPVLPGQFRLFFVCYCY